MRNVATRLSGPLVTRDKLQRLVTRHFPRLASCLFLLWPVVSLCQLSTSVGRSYDTLPRPFVYHLFGWPSAYLVCSSNSVGRLPIGCTSISIVRPLFSRLSPKINGPVLMSMPCSHLLVCYRLFVSSPWMFQQDFCLVLLACVRNL